MLRSCRTMSCTPAISAAKKDTTVSTHTRGLMVARSCSIILDGGRCEGKRVVSDGSVEGRTRRGSKPDDVGLLTVRKRDANGQPVPRGVAAKIGAWHPRKGLMRRRNLGDVPVGVHHGHSIGNGRWPRRHKHLDGQPGRR